MSVDTDYYKNFTEEELAADEYFQQWVLIADEESQRYWTSFVERCPHQQITVNNASRLVQHLAQTGFHLPLLSATEKQGLKEGIMEKITLPAISAGTKQRRSTKQIWWLSVAATVAVVFVVFRLSGSSPTPETLAFIKTPVKTVKTILLPDSSTVVLNGNSSLRYSNNLDAAAVREVFLEGNAYFHVKQTPERTPFIVHANQLKIYVTGTEFNVNARTKATDVVLTSGRINVTLEGNKRKTVYLQPGYSLMVDTLSNELITTKSPTQIYTAAWNQGEWHFEQTQLSVVARLIKEYYGVDMVFAQPELLNRMITAVVPVSNFTTLLQVIEKTLNLDIQTQNQQLIIINPQSKQV